MGFPDRIERTVELAHPVEKVWAALTTDDGLSSWFSTSAKLDLRPGGEGQLRWERENVSATVEIKVVEPPHRFAFTGRLPGLPPADPRRTFVEFTLEATQSGTRLTVTESGFAQLPPELAEDSYHGNVEGWEIEFGELSEYLDGAA